MGVNIELVLRCSCPPACLRSLQCPGPTGTACGYWYSGTLCYKTLENSTHLPLQVSVTRALPLQLSREG